MQSLRIKWFQINVTLHVDAYCIYCLIYKEHVRISGPVRRSHLATLLSSISYFIISVSADKQ
jgi:hypothetical protein